MRGRARPHVLGIDDGPFEKRVTPLVDVVGVMMEGADLVEAVATTRFPQDGAESAGFLAAWVSGLRCRPALQGVILGGITIAGLGLVDVRALARGLGLPVLVVNRREPTDARLAAALRTAGLGERVALLRAAPPSFRVGRLHVSAAGIEREPAERLVRETRRKSELPEPLRLAHLIARAIATGESRGRP
jgi:endonuclease V-like protein UPF0215 family